MTQFIFANNINTTLAASVTATSTVLTLASSANLPTLGVGQVMPVTLISLTSTEICYATAINGADLTVERGQENTAAQPWAVGATVYCAPTAGTVAPVNGSPENAFEVFPAQSAADAVQLAQVSAVAPQYHQQTYVPASGQTYTISNDFTAPCNGFILAASTINVSEGPQPIGCANQISINGTVYGLDNTINPMTNWGVAPVSSGTSCTVVSTFTAGISANNFAEISQTVMSIFIPNP